MLIKPKNQLRVCMITARFYPHLGGLERQAYKLAKSLVNTGVNVSILTRNYERLMRHEVVDGMDIYRMPVLGRSRYTISLSYIFSCLSWLIKHRRDYQIVHCHQNYSPATIGSLAKFLLGKPVVVKNSSSGDIGEVYQINNKLPFKRLRKLLLSMIDKFIIVNHQMQKELESIGILDKKIVFIPNGVEVLRESCFEDGVRDKYKRKLNLPFNKIVIFAGRLSPHKDLPTLILAWEKVCRRFKDAQLLIIGKADKINSDELRIKELVYRLQLCDSVRFLGMVDEINEYLLASDIFVLPSVSEGMSNALLEAMGAGVGVIATDNPGSRELIKNEKNGILVKAGDTKGFADMISLLFENPQLNKKLGIEAKETIKERFSMDRITEQYKKLYQELLNLEWN